MCCFMENIALLTELLLSLTAGSINIPLRWSGKSSSVLHRTHQLRQSILRVAVKHSGDRFKEERILES